MSVVALWTLVILPASVGATLCLASGRAERIAAPVSLVTALALAGLSAAVAITRPASGTRFVADTALALAVDDLSALVVPTVAAVTLLVLVFASADIGSSRARFHGLMLLFAAAVMVTATATTLPTLLLGWEVMGAMSYALIGFWWREPRRVSAGLTAFLVTRSADLGLYAASGAALAGGAGLALANLPLASDGWRQVAAGGVLVAALGKAAQLPFSFWLSQAMEGPSPVSALLHSAAMVAMGGYLLLRVAPLLAASGWPATVAAWTGAVTALLLGAVALAQRDLKQLLAASTAAQLGFVVLAAGVGSVSGGATQLVAHAATKSLLFLAAGAWLAALGTKQLSALRGVGRRWPLTGACAAIGALALAGIPPLSLWATKDEVLSAARETSPALYAIGLAASALSAAYAGKLLFVLWRQPPAGIEQSWDTERPGSRRIAARQELPMAVLAAAAAVLGLLALPPAGTALRRALDAASATAAGTAELALSAALALGVLAAVWRWSPPQPRLLVRWLGLAAVADALVVRPVLRLSEALARFDDRVVDGAVGRVSAAVAANAARLAMVDDRHVDGVVAALARSAIGAASAAAVVERRGLDSAVEALARAIRRAGDLARWPQTGQLHHYYAMALVVLALGLGLVLVVH